MDWQAMVELQPGLAHVPESLRACAEYLILNAGQIVFRTGNRVGSMLSVISGEVCLVRHSRSGGEIILHRSRGGFLAEASLNTKVYHCDAVARRESSLLLFPIKPFRVALDTDTTFRNTWMDRLAYELRRSRAQCERLSLRNAADRILHYIESEGTDGTVVLSQSRKAWAAELGLTHEALYRTLGKLQAEGRLHVDGQSFALR